MICVEYPRTDCSPELGSRRPGEGSRRGRPSRSGRTGQRKPPVRTGAGFVQSSLTLPRGRDATDDAGIDRTHQPRTQFFPLDDALDLSLERV